uniref:Uncharacterized protein n=1 Tax=viral metagenome TaxID=1070528 RepID=A0A6M3XH95_9ZZZZ
MPDIFELGFSPELDRSEIFSGSQSDDMEPPAVSVVPSSVSGDSSPIAIASGELASIIFTGKETFDSTEAGYRMGIDQSDGIYKWIIGDSTSSIDWAVTTAATLTITGAGLVSPTLSYGKTSLADSTNAGYWISSDGVYIGAAADATAFKYTVAGGTFDFIGTVSSRSTATLAAAIDASGDLVTDVINARIDSESKKLLSDFNFGTDDYAGAVKSGDIAWNTTTGAITGGSGVVVYRGGIIGAAAGVATFSIDAATGSATFAGTLSAPTGTIGGFTIGADYIKDAADSFGLASTVSGGDDVRFWAGDTFANRATAPFRITEAGTIVATSAVVNGSSISNNDIYGNGEDSDGTITGDTSLTKDTFYNDLSISNNATLTTDGYRLFIKGTLTIESGSKIAWNGNDGTAGSNASTNAAVSGGAGGTALSSASLYGSGAGKTGGASGAGGTAGGDGGGGTAGTSGDAITNSFADSFSSGSGSGGNGGGSAIASGGSSGAAGGISASSIRPYNSIFAVEMFDKAPGATPATLKYNSNVGGAGGGGGGKASAGGGVAGAGGGGGGAGSGGGVMVVAAKIVVNNGSIESIGGAGGAGGNGANGGATGSGFNNGGGGGGGGGTGGPGGVIVFIYSTLSGAGTVSVLGGTGGTGGTKGNQGTGGTTTAEATNGQSGSTGESGKLITLIV